MTVSGYSQVHIDNMNTWRSLMDVINKEDFGSMDQFFHDQFVYENPSRPDMKGFELWKQGASSLAKVFPPCKYTIRQITAEGDNFVWVLCHHYGIHKARYMGVEATGNEMQIEWVSIVEFKDAKILRIKSIADVLTQLIQIGLIDKAKLPVDPYR